ncbi:hypothetical protein CKM354_000582000 [Cercospora kikuchii]|uniref:RING-type domain-containing protein n=1 Tax=Cercospora kikuchii TaxID=84275 RepID=A0A9P3FCS8_9PEZI|nr:uncharacterized protein CKM354_000582000 [Cercospora kikuchii]GIZ42558.1 hypothetical protein CKM354_000582000 [Cercospora kikuchii]
MTTLAQFLATGLKPVAQVPEEDCSICYDNFQEPVSVTCPANHIFCKSCIEEWLIGAAGFQCSCPVCRAPLYDEQPPPATDPIAHEWDQIWELALSFANPTTRDEATTTDPYSIAIEFLRSRQAHTTDGILRLIRQRNGQNYTIPIAGRGVIPSIDRLRGPIRALAALIRARAQLSGGRAWNERQVAEWDEIIAHTEAVVQNHQQQRYATVSDVSTNFMRELHREWRRNHGRRAVLPDFLTPELDQLSIAVLDLVAYLAYKEAKAQARVDSQQSCLLM